MSKPTEQNASLLYSTSRISAIGKGNSEFVKRMLTVFVEQMNETIIQLNVSIHNPDQVYTILHQAKPSIAEICNPSVLQLIDTIEKLAKRHHTNEMIEHIQLFMLTMQEIMQAISLGELSKD